MLLNFQKQNLNTSTVGVDFTQYNITANLIPKL